MRMKSLAIMAAGLLVAGRALAGNLDPTNAPGPTMHTLEEIYQKLQSLDPDTQQTLSDTSPSLNAGYYAATNLTQVDADLTAANIKAGTTIFGIAGRTEVVDTTSGDAVAGDVLSGKKVWVDGVEVSGTMGTQTLSPVSAIVASGYYMATNLAQVDADLVAANIKTNVTIFGITGTLSTNSGYSAVVQKTGITASYQAGDDGSYQKGAVWPSPRFTVQATNCVLDNLTGLIWAREANLTNVMTWTEAITYCENLTYGGYSDWRLPNLKELLSLIDYSRRDPPVHSSSPFVGIHYDVGAGVPTTYYWSSTYYPYNPSAIKWYMDMDNGLTSATSSTNTFYVWPVRGGQ